VLVSITRNKEARMSGLVGRLLMLDGSSVAGDGRRLPVQVRPGEHSLGVICSRQTPPLFLLIYLQGMVTDYFD
jgi:hypothetical protein